MHDALADGRRGVAVISSSLSMCLSSTLGELTATARVVFERPQVPGGELFLLLSRYKQEEGNVGITPARSVH